MTSTGSGAGWIERANARSIGRTEFRHVTMMITGTRGGRTLEIRTLRQLEGDTCRSLFCVMEPRMFRGVSYVAIEKRTRLAMDVTLYLPYMLGTVREIEPARCGETFLGSDFSYDDLRTWLPDTGFHYEAPATGRVASELQLRGRRIDDALEWRHGSKPFDVYLDAQTGFVVGIDYLGENSEIIRSMRVPARTRIDGIELPLEIEMRTPGTTTTLFLQRARFDLEIEAGMFSAGRCAQRRTYLGEL